MPKLASIDDQSHTIGLLQDIYLFSTTSLESQESYFTNMSLDHSRFFRLHSTFTRLCNAAPSPASLGCLVGNRPIYSCVLSYLAMNASEAGGDLALIETSLLF